jgi:hypothetical protein
MSSTDRNSSKGETSILLFEFDEVYLRATITDYENIRFIYNEANKSIVKGFEITIKDSTVEKIEYTKEQIALPLIDFLSTIAVSPITYKPPKIRKIRNGQIFHVVSKSFIAKYSISNGIDNNIDVSKSKMLSLLLANDSKMVRELKAKLAHAHKGNRAFSNGDYSQAIREYYLILENTDFQRKQIYKSLRDAVSHHELDVSKTIEKLKFCFGITIAKGEFLNVNNPEIKKILREEAGRLRESVWFYLIKQGKNEKVNELENEAASEHSKNSSNSNKDS